jgi:hypothetical protein
LFIFYGLAALAWGCPARINPNQHSNAKMQTKCKPNANRSKPKTFEPCETAQICSVQRLRQNTTQLGGLALQGLMLKSKTTGL